MNSLNAIPLKNARNVDSPVLHEKILKNSKNEFNRFQMRNYLMWRKLQYAVKFRAFGDEGAC